MSMTNGRNTVFDRFLFIKISSEVDVLKHRVWCYSNIIEVREFKNVRINQVTLTDDFEIQG